MHPSHDRVVTSVSSACLLLGLLAGCSPPADDPIAGAKPEPFATATADVVPPAARPAEAFEPPPLDRLEDNAKWIDRPVRDGLTLLRAAQEKEPLLATAAEALDLENDSADANAKILSGLGRLPADHAADLAARIDRHVAGDLGSTNPIMISTSAEFDILGLTGFGLFSFGRDLEPFASAETVTSWQTSADGLLDKVVLRDDLVWSDGTPITAHDVAFSYTVIMDPRVPVPAVRSGTDQMRAVHAYDDRTLVFFHREPLATNVWNINFPVLPRHVYEKTWEDDPSLKDSPAHVKLEAEPVVGGPYEIVERTRGQQIVLRRRKSWSHVNGKRVRDEPFFAEIRFRIIEDPNTSLLALKSGEIDEMMLQPEQWTTQTTDAEFYARNTKATAPEWVSFHFGWNIGTPFFADRRVRRAMTYAFDHDRMLDKLCYGLYTPCAGPFAADSWMAAGVKLEPAKQDLDTAEALLDEAGWIDRDNDGIRDKEIDGKLVPFEFSLLVNQQPHRIKICTLLKENLDQIGIRMSVRPLEATVLQQLTQEKKFQAYFGGWGSGTDPDSSENIWATGAGRNFVGYSNPEVDRLFVEGRREFDKAKRAEKYRRIQQILSEDQPYTWLYWRNSFYGFSRDLRGYVFSPRGPYHYSPGFGSIWKPRAE
ncbi:peptide ABC transporter substrate-binding protein [bacterium]|nr:peptide ABC transporter substrate-binding protein [bacterium]